MSISQYNVNEYQVWVAINGQPVYAYKTGMDKGTAVRFAKQQPPTAVGLNATFVAVKATMTFEEVEA